MTEISNKKALTKEQILNTKDLPSKQVNIPEWNGCVYLKALSGKERDNFEAFWLKKSEKQNRFTAASEAKLYLLSMCLVSEQGDKLFTHEDMKKVNEKSGAVLNRLFDIATNLNGIGNEAVEEMRKNS